MECGSTDLPAPQLVLVLLVLRVLGPGAARRRRGVVQVELAAPVLLYVPILILCRLVLRLLLLVRRLLLFVVVKRLLLLRYVRGGTEAGQPRAGHIVLGAELAVL